MTDTYHMDIETAEGVKPHGFHLGTDLAIARRFALEALQRKGVMSVALRHGPKGKLVEILDWRSLEDVNEVETRADRIQRERPYLTRFQCKTLAVQEMALN